MNNMRGRKIPDLNRIFADELMDHDLLVIYTERLERDEDGEMVDKRTCAVSLGDLKKYLRKK